MTLSVSVTVSVTCPRAVRDIVRELSVTLSVSVTCPRAVRDFVRVSDRVRVRDLSASCP